MHAWFQSSVTANVRPRHMKVIIITRKIIITIVSYCIATVVITHMHAWVQSSVTANVNPRNINVIVGITNMCCPVPELGDSALRRVTKVTIIIEVIITTIGHYIAVANQS